MSDSCDLYEGLTPDDYFARLLDGTLEDAVNIPAKVSTPNPPEAPKPKPVADQVPKPHKALPAPDRTSRPAPQALAAEAPQTGFATWSEAKTGYPVPFARSALFRAGEGKEGEGWLMKEKIPMPAAKGISLVYSGPRLNQKHALVFQALVEATEGATHDLIVSHGDILTLLDIHCSTIVGHQWLWKHITDLIDARITVDTVRSKYHGGLIHSVTQDKRTGMLAIALDHRLSGLFSNEVIRTSVTERATLGNGQLTQWLHLYLSSHKKCLPIAIKELLRLSGSSLVMKKFRYAIKDAMRKLSAGPDPLIISWSIDSKDKLVFDKRYTKVKMLTKGDKPEKPFRDTKAVGCFRKGREQRGKVAL